MNRREFLSYARQVFNVIFDELHSRPAFAALFYMTCALMVAVILAMIFLQGCAHNPYYSGTATQHLAGKP